ncbi:MAG: biotin/lipoyl-binding protein, partial [Opitutales bacterium]
MKHPLRLPCLLLLAGLLPAAGCRRASTAAAGPAPVPVQVATVLQQDVPRRIESLGTVQALRTVAVKSQIDGIIAKVHFHEGDEVKAGDLLVTLDCRPFENALQQAQAALATSRAEAAQAAVDAAR